MAVTTVAQDNQALDPGAEAPTFYLRTLEGENFFLSREIQDDSPMVLAFYATWCVPCRVEIPALEKMMQAPELEGGRLYYVNVGGLMAPDEAGDVIKQRENEERIRAHRAELSMTHPILLDRYALTARKFSATSLPTTVVIGGDATIKYVHQGYTPGDEAELQSILQDIVK